MHSYENKQAYCCLYFVQNFFESHHLRLMVVHSTLDLTLLHNTLDMIKSISLKELSSEDTKSLLLSTGLVFNVKFTPSRTS